MRQPWVLALMAGLLAGGGVVAWKLLWPERTSGVADRERPIVAAIERLGGTVRVDEADPDRPVVAVDLTCTDCTNADLERLSGLTRLRTLNLGGTRITDAGLADLKGQTGLEELYLLATPLTDAGLDHLRGLTGLRILDLSATRVTDRGLEHLKGLTGLRTLNLAATRVTPRAIWTLRAALPDLEIQRNPF
jgi:hypothetical protein